MTRNKNGRILYRGPSQLDGRPIVVVLTGLKRTGNRKTGKMLQVWILPANRSYLESIRTGYDSTVCGDCPLRGIIVRDKQTRKLRNILRGCYVSYHAPQSISAAVARGSYADFNWNTEAHLLTDRKIRFGAYGDPVAAPYALWSRLARLSAGHTGYTHQHAQGRLWRFRSLLMASCETPEQALDAQSRGWRTFRSTTQADDLGAHERRCPASEEMGHRTTCDRCQACDGAGDERNLVIIAHGSKSVTSNYRKITA